MIIDRNIIGNFKVDIYLWHFKTPLNIANIVSPCPRASSIGHFAPKRQDLNIVLRRLRYRAL